jgi:hypothetical protein
MIFFEFAAFFYLSACNFLTLPEKKSRLPAIFLTLPAKKKPLDCKKKAVGLQRKQAG